MSKREIVDFRANPDAWKSPDMESFIKTGAVKYTDNWSSDFDDLEDRVSRYRAPGAWNQQILSQMLFEREFDSFVTADGESFLGEDDASFEARFLDDAVLDSWATKFNHTRSGSKGLQARDEILFLKTLKHLYANKGTQKCIEIFFQAYYDEKVEVYIPKFDICYLEDNFILDHDKVLRDDSVYQEYSYVVYVQNDPSFYAKEFEDVYIKNFHPGGFKVTLIKKTTP
jgi:hypothetical protein